MRWRRVRSAIAAAAFALVGAAQNAALAESLELIGAYELPAGLKIGGVAFGGISGIDYDPAGDVFLALSDDRGRGKLNPPRFYEIALKLEPDGVKGMDIRQQIAILNAKDGPFKDGAIDPEGLRLGPSGAIFWAQEGGDSGAPSVSVMGRDGRQLATFAIPHYYTRQGEPKTATLGVRDNFGFEALAFGPKGEVVVGVEQPLRQDGPTADVGRGAYTRVLVLSAEGDGGRAIAEHVYPLDPVPIAPDDENAFRTNGLVELLARPDGGFYALERAFVQGKGSSAALYKTSFDGASNVLGAASLKDLSPRAMRKQLLLKLPGKIDGMRIDNLEGMSFGPSIGGRRSLILISDDNFNEGVQKTQILLFAIEE